MGVPPYILSQVMLEEHRHNTTRNMPDLDWPPAQPVERKPRLVTVRQRLSEVLRFLADRLDPSGTRPYAVQLVVMPYPGDGGQTTQDSSASSKRESHG
jgi:hypothetical protein